MLRGLQAALLLLAVLSWYYLPSTARTWEVLGPNVLVETLTVFATISIVEFLLARHRRAIGLDAFIRTQASTQWPIVNFLKLLREHVTRSEYEWYRKEVRRGGLRFDDAHFRSVQQTVVDGCHILFPRDGLAKAVESLEKTLPIFAVGLQSDDLEALVRYKNALLALHSLILDESSDPTAIVQHWAVLAEVAEELHLVPRTQIPYLRQLILLRSAVKAKGKASGP